VKQLVCRYPGDPPVEVLELSREEFLKLCPREPITLTSFDPVSGTIEKESFPMGFDEIYCDLCNEDPGETIYLYARTQARCKSCYNKALKRYCFDL
jgi:hypothetical protein